MSLASLDSDCVAQANREEHLHIYQKLVIFERSVSFDVGNKIYGAYLDLNQISGLKE